MDYATLSIWSIALVLGAIAYFRKDGSFRGGLSLAREQTRVSLPRIVMMMIVAGFFAQIIPAELVAHWLGKDAGLRGILVASLVGGLTPGGPIVCFPVALILLKAGAAVPALISFLTAWSVFAFHRVMAYELPFMGARFVMIRLGSCIFLPPLAGVAASLMMGSFNITI